MGESSLGNIFEEDERARAEKPRGPDLHVTVQVPRTALGDPAGYRVPIADAIEHEGVLVPRKVNPEDAAGVPLHLPESLTDNAVLRLRGQGGVHEGGIAGDLYVKVQVVEPPPPSLLWLWVVLALAVLGGGTALLWTVV